MSEKSSRCSAILPIDFITGRKAGQCRKQARGTVETNIGYRIVHPVCDSPVCREWIIYAGKSVLMI
jgi:hypothetical protein